MAVKIPAPERVDAHDSTWIELDGAGEIQKITTYPRFATEWRGEPVIVTMSCDRYRYADGRLSDWRFYASEARVQRGANYWTGPNVTDTARSRLSEACRPATAAWLESAEFCDRYRRAIAAAIVRELSGSRTDATRARRFVAKWAGDALEPERVGLLFAACDARDAYDAALDAAGA